MAGAKRPDAWIIIITMCILAIGIVMVYSASYATAGETINDTYFFVKRQLLWALVGLVGMYVMSRIDYHIWRLWALPGYLLAIALLGLVLVVGGDVMGAQRWIHVGPLSMQPSEFVKLALINFLAAYLASRRADIERFINGFALPLGLILLAVALIMLEPDLGTSVAIIGIAVMMLYAAGTRIRHLVMLAVAAVPAVYALIRLAPYRMRRFTAFINPWSDPLDSGWNIIQSLLAIGSGGLFGLGLGASRQKYHYLPEQYTDFIFAILAEELGLIGAATLMLLFLVLAWRGYRAALRAPDLFGCLFAVGITTMIALQAFLNIAVVCSIVPATGITLPLVSAGGSSLSITLAGLGVLLNISAAGVSRKEG